MSDSGGPLNQTDRAFVSQESPVRPMSILQKVWVLQGKSVQGKVIAKRPNAHRIHENGILIYHKNQPNVGIYTYTEPIPSMYGIFSYI